MQNRHKLNERPIYLRSVYFQLALVQIGLHIWNGLDDVIIPVAHPSVKTTDRTTHSQEPVLAQIQQILPSLLGRAAAVASCTTIASPFIYTTLFRGIFWSAHMAMAKLFFNIPRSNASPDKYPPSNPALMFRAFWTGCCLLFLWEVSAFLFAILLAQEPLKKGVPLSNESKDPNGTLLSGLKAKKDTVKTFAMWELAYIAQRLPDRRKAIFADIERAGGPTWTQMLQISLSIIQSIETRVRASQSPAQSSQQPGANPNGNVQVESLPRLVPDAKSAENIFAASPLPRTRGEKLESTLGPFARSIGQSAPWSPSANERVKGFLEYPSQKTSELVRASRTEHSASFLPEAVRDYVVAILRSPLGFPFRHSFPRSLSSVILSSPNAQTSLIVDAIDSTSRMLVASLSEDLYGKAQATVPDTVRTFATTINVIEALIENMQPHWTDVDFDYKGAEVPEDIQVVLERLKSGLEELLSAFQLYLRDVGLSDSDLATAQKAVNSKPKLRQPKVKPTAAAGPSSSSSSSSSSQSRLSSASSTTNQNPPQKSNLPPPSSSSIPPNSKPQQPQQRKRLEERDRGKDLEFLRDIPPSNNKSKGKEKEKQREMEQVPR